MTDGLKKHFPMIQDREEVLAEIQSNHILLSIFNSWKECYQKEFLDFCTGVRGVKLLYDRFFKEIINPDTTPERLEELLSLILQTRVRIVKILPNDSARIAAESSFLILDVVVELEDGSLANVEAQKLGYKFPGQRSACYSADLLLRQYKRVKGERGKKFSYQDIKKVYTIVFFEQSTEVFHNQKYAENYTYIHYSKQEMNTGLQMELLQEYVFIALDILRIKVDNIGIDNDNKLEAWLTFLSDDKPERILELIKKYPEFKPLYEEVYRMCRNMEDIMGIFSEELLILDKNTAQLMVDEMQEEIKEKQEELKEKQEELNELIGVKNALIEEANEIKKILKEKDEKAEAQIKTIEEQAELILKLQAELMQVRIQNEK